jgi:hypothetical protein
MDKDEFVRIAAMIRLSQSNDDPADATSDQITSAVDEAEKIYEAVSSEMKKRKGPQDPSVIFKAQSERQQR